MEISQNGNIPLTRIKGFQVSNPKKFLPYEYGMTEYDAYISKRTGTKVFLKDLNNNISQKIVLTKDGKLFIGHLEHEPSTYENGKIKLYRQLDEDGKTLQFVPLSTDKKKEISKIKFANFENENFGKKVISFIKNHQPLDEKLFEAPSEDLMSIEALSKDKLLKPTSLNGEWKTPSTTIKANTMQKFDNGEFVHVEHESFELPTWTSLGRDERPSISNRFMEREYNQKLKEIEQDEEKLKAAIVQESTKTESIPEIPVSEIKSEVKKINPQKFSFKNIFKLLKR